MSDYDQLLAERNQLAAEVGRSAMALGVLANIYDAFLEKKGEAWCKHWEALPLNQVLNNGVPFRMPTLEDCRIAKAAAENDQSEYQPE